VELLGADGEPRRQFLAGEPLSLRLRLVAEQPLAPPSVHYELRSESGLLIAGGVQDTAELGWPRAGGELRLRFDVERLPLADGRFHLRIGLSAEGGRLLHQLDEAASFLVVPEGEERGFTRVDGRWSREEIAAAAELHRVR
jgi:hypothetical protein